ncbi:Hypothetical_protein [Hexamita inflata]|uniref:Hypothetical_protein n=1 Tax=Hexamita inflata TaxID=28002 RepID=A0AA86UJJ1_9EUKA|nr:Hypothetical protein HINF_LOCUS41656 [Hexamita inflata]
MKGIRTKTFCTLIINTIANSQIDNEEFDIQPTVSFVVPGTLLDGSKIILRTKYKAIDEQGQMIIKDTGDYTVTLPKEFGTRQTELMYLVEIANLIQDQIQAKIDKEYLVIAQTEWLQKHLKARFAITGEQTTIKFPEESCWLAKLLGAKIFKSNNFTAGQITRDGQTITVDEDGNELDANGLIKTLFNKTMYKTNADKCVTFDYTMYLNLIKTVHITCKYITKQTVLAKYKQYIILKHTLDITPLARVKITSDFLSTISKDQLYKGIQISFYNEDFHLIPMDDNTFYEVELSISKSRKRAQLEIDMKTVSEGEQRRKERQFQDEMFATQQRALQEFQLNYEDNKQQFAQNIEIHKKYKADYQNNYELIEEALEKTKTGEIALNDKQYKVITKYLQIDAQYRQQLNNMQKQEEYLYQKATDFNIPQHEQIKAAKQLSEFYKQQQQSSQFQYQQLSEMKNGIQKRIMAILGNEAYSIYTQSTDELDEINEQKEHINKNIKSTNLQPLAETALQELIIKRDALKQSLADKQIDEKQYDYYYKQFKQEYQEKLQRYTLETQALADEYNEEAAYNEVLQAYQMNQNFKSRKDFLNGKQTRQAQNELNDKNYKEKLEEISRKYHENKGDLYTAASDRQFKTKLEERARQQQQEEYQKQQYINMLLSQLDEQQRIQYSLSSQQDKEQFLSELHKQYQNSNQQNTQ